MNVPLIEPHQPNSTYTFYLPFFKLPQSKATRKTPKLSSSIFGVPHVGHGG